METIPSGEVEQEKFPDGFSNAAASRQIVNAIMKSQDGKVGKTLGDIYRTNHNEYSWSDFLAAVDYMVTVGILEGKGDGFDVKYSLTPKADQIMKSLEH